MMSCLSLLACDEFSVPILTFRPSGRSIRAEAVARVRHAKFVERTPKRRVQLADGRQHRFLGCVEVIGHGVDRCGRNAVAGQLPAAVHVVDAQRQLTVARQVGVAADEDLVGIGRRAHFRQVAWVVAVLRLRDADDLVDVGQVSGHARDDAAPGLTRAAVGREARRRRFPGEVEVTEEEGLVLLDRPADAEARLLVLEQPDLGVGGIGHGWRGYRRDLANQVLVPGEPIAGAGEGVGAALCHGVHRAAREAALTNVVGRDDELNLLNCIEADWL